MKSLPKPTRIAAAAALTLALLTPLQAPTASAEPAPDRTSRAEARRVDSVPTPTLDWFPCDSGLQCATVWLPLDYDKPRGEQVEIALKKVSATRPDKKLGTVFVNPGGPGVPGSGSVQLFAASVTPEVRERFDVIGFDPRGIGSSTQVKCFPTVRDQTRALQGVDFAFPHTPAQIDLYESAMRKVATGCSSTGKPISAAMSTAQVARDMDVLRRAVGDEKLTYLGTSYGTYLGQVYANMFPDRVRALIIDGVLDPEAWAGTRTTFNEPVTLRLRSAEGAWKALNEALKRCAEAGPDYCRLQDPVADFERVVAALKAGPVTVTTPYDTYTVRYEGFIGMLLGQLYSEWGAEGVTGSIADLLSAIDGDAAPADREAAALRLSAAFAAYDFPYDNNDESFASVLCTDSRNPRRAGVWEPAITQNEQSAPHFSQAWGWSSLICAGAHWKALDEDAYRGPFTKRTSAPVLVVGSYWDPATNYEGAVRAAELLPNSRLLSSDNWGHLALATSDCVTNAMSSYILDGILPPEGTVCQGHQPFSEPLEQPDARSRTTSTQSTTAQTSNPTREKLEELLREASPALR